MGGIALLAIQISLINSKSGKKMPERYGFASLSIVDIENRITQYVFVFLENDRVIISGDISSQNKNKSLTLTEVCEQSVEDTLQLATGSFIEVT